MTTSFVQQASVPAIELEDLLLAAAAEFRPVDRPRAAALLDDLVADLRPVTARRPDAERHAEALLSLFDRRGFLVARRLEPVDALLDAVLERRQGHPLLLASIGAAVGKRVGIDAVPVRCGGVVFIGIRVDDRAVLLDLGGECAPPARRSTWMCAHEVAFEALSEVSRLFALHGRVSEAIQGAELRPPCPSARDSGSESSSRSTPCARN